MREPIRIEPKNQALSQGAGPLRLTPPAIFLATVSD
jgi:hypothetical protein